MNGILIGFVAGAAVFHWLNFVADPIWCVPLLPGIVLWRYRRLRPVVAMCLGGCWSLVQVHQQMAHWLPERLEGRDLILLGVVEDLPVIEGRLQRFPIRVRSLQDLQGNPVQVGRVELSWFGQRLPLRTGEIWRLKVRLKQPRGLHNPIGFDAERAMLSRRVGARGYVRTWEKNQRLESAGIRGSINRLRQAIAQGLDEYSGTSRNAALFKALAVGDRRSLDARDWQVFTRTGTNHLMAISGLHVGIVAGWSLWLGSRLWRRREGLCQRLPSLKAGAWLSLFSAVTYAALAGFSLPTQRALIMLVVVLGSLMLGLRVSLGKGLLWALFLVVLWDPLAPLQTGFWLSFLAVATIWWTVAGRLHIDTGWRQGVLIQGVVTLGLLPVLFLCFGQASLIAPLVNLVMVPWFSLVLVPLLLIGLPLLLFSQAATLWYSGLGYLANLTFRLLDGSASFSLAALSLPHVDAWVWILVLLGLLLWLMPRGMPGRWMGLWCCLPLMQISPERPASGAFWLTLLDVGQGLACVVETRDHVLLYDSGPGSVGGYSAAQAVVIPYLLSRGVERIDRMILSNGDQDHAGGAQVLQSAFPVVSMLSGEVERVPGATACQAGTHWIWEGVTFRILHPAAEDRFSESNNRSCVLQIQSGDQRVLLPGDVEQRVERQLVQRYGATLQSQILIAPHHGSAGSSSNELVQAVAPDWVLFSTGYRNLYDFPKREVVERWRGQGAFALNTAQEGAIQFRISPVTHLGRPERYCADPSHYWQNCPVSDFRYVSARDAGLAKDTSGDGQ